MIKILTKFRIFLRDIKFFIKFIILFIYEYFFSLNKLLIPKFKVISPIFNFTDVTPRRDVTSTFVIIFQGPFYGKFTLDTIDLYKRLYPDIGIIFSTWKGLPEDIILKLRKSDVILLLNDDVCHSYDNQNRMIASTYAGLIHASKIYPNSFAIKHRGDQRLTSFDWVRNIEDLLLSYPAINSFGSAFRIGSLSACSGKLRPYMLGDQFQFGHIDDLLELWSAPFVEEGLHQLFKYFKFDGFTKYGFGIKADNYLIGHYIMRKGIKLDFSLEDSNKFWSSKGIIIDAHSVGFFWARKEFDKKIESFFDCNPFNGSVSYNCGVSALSFSDWLHIYRTGKLSYDGLKPEIWIVENVKNKLPIYKILSIGGFANSKN
jgi:hypothetical protein